jgi:hypothetical protein
MSRQTVGSKALLSAMVARNDLINSSILADFLRTKKDAEARIQVGGTSYAVIDVVIAPEGVILLTDKNDKPMKASSIVKELGESEGLAVFLDVEGQLIPAKTLTKDGVQAAETKSTSQVMSSLDFNSIKAGLGRFASDDSWFDPKDQSMNGAATLWGRTKNNDTPHCYVSYDEGNDEVQVGLLDADFTPEDILFDGSLKDMKKAIEIATTKGKARFDVKALDMFKKHITKILTGSLDDEEEESDEHVSTTPVDESLPDTVETEQQPPETVVIEQDTYSSLVTGTFTNKLEAKFTESDSNWSGATTLYGAPDSEQAKEYKGVVFAYKGQDDLLSFETLDAKNTPEVVFRGGYKSLGKYLKMALKLGFQFSSKSSKEFINSVKRQFDARTKHYATEAVMLKTNIIANKDNSKAFARFKLWAKVNKLNVEILELTDELLSVTVSDLGKADREEILKVLEDSVTLHKKNAMVEVEDEGKDFIAFNIEF